MGRFYPATAHHRWVGEGKKPLPELELTTDVAELEAQLSDLAQEAAQQAAIEAEDEPIVGCPTGF